MFWIPEANVLIGPSRLVIDVYLCIHVLCLSVKAELSASVILGDLLVFVCILYLQNNIIVYTFTLHKITHYIGITFTESGFISENYVIRDVK